ncbi:MAG TPA: alpha/beta hydrolase [Pseudomonadales bacterium]|nr:alpha/beta hydrolase [Pseudomonadales bacterium]
MDFVKVENGPVTLNVAVQGEGPLILCVHGWPELWYSWRHQMAHFSRLGYRVAAMDVRGYGGSSRPEAIAAYSLRHLASDTAAVIDALGDGTAILFGHDWGAPIVWHTALLHPERVRAVAGLSVPYTARGESSLLEVARILYADRYFYMLHFQEEGVAEAEFEADMTDALRKTYYALSGDAPENVFLQPKPADAGFLDGLEDPQPFPAWLSDADLQVYVDAFEAGGMRGPINRYRAQELDFVDLAALEGAPVTQPAFFVAGAQDAVRAMIPGADLFADPSRDCTDFRGSVILPGIGHWVQQEAPQATNAALEGFLAGL